MADQTTLINWIISHRAEMDLRVRECIWIRDIFPGWYDLEATISLDGKKFCGRGCSKSADGALAKAFCEAVERSLCHANGLSSLGVAGHLSAEMAKENGRFEYLERYTFFEHITKGWKLRELQLNPKIREKYSQRGVKIDLYSLNTDLANVVLAISSGIERSNPFGGVLGLGAHQDGKIASRKAILECLQGVEAFLDHPSPSLSHQEFTILKSPTALDRQSLFRDRAYFTKIMGVLSGEPDRGESNIEGRFEELRLEAPLLMSCPLKFFRFVPLDGKDITLEFVG